MLFRFNVIEAYAALGRDVPVNLRFCLEAMEEDGSKGLPELCRRLGVPGGFLDPEAIEFVCISDNYWTGKAKPSREPLAERSGGCRVAVLS